MKVLVTTEELAATLHFIERHSESEFPDDCQRRADAILMLIRLRNPDRTSTLEELRSQGDTIPWVESSVVGSAEPEFNPGPLCGVCKSGDHKHHTGGACPYCACIVVPPVPEPPVQSLDQPVAAAAPVDDDDDGMTPDERAVEAVRALQA